MIFINVSCSCPGQDAAAEALSSSQGTGPGRINFCILSLFHLFFATLSGKS